MIEHVESVHAELCAEPLRDPELLHRRQIGLEPRRPMERVPANVAQVSDTRVAESARVGDDIRSGGEVRNGMCDRVKRAQSRVE